MDSRSLILIILFVVPLHSVTVKPSALCPTNKIAPYRRILSVNGNTRPRTIGVFYDLLTNNNGQNDEPSNQQEETQQDDPDDCGDIEDYDENDLSSLTPQQNTYRQREQSNRFFFGDGVFNRPQYGLAPGQIPVRPTMRPISPTFRPTRPQYPPTRPPYWSGGVFGNNPYRPPLEQLPSNNVKPVHEYDSDVPATYRPLIVGGPLSHVVGVSPVRPTRFPVQDATSSRAPVMPLRFPNRRSTSATEYTTRRSGPRRLNNNNSGIFGSFIDLLFK